MLEGDPLQQTLMGLQCHRVRLLWASLEARWDNSKVSQRLNSKQHNVCPPIYPPSPQPADLCCPLLSGFLLQLLLLSSVLTPQLRPVLHLVRPSPAPILPLQTQSSFPTSLPAQPFPVLCPALPNDQFHVYQR